MVPAMSETPQEKAKAAQEAAKIKAAEEKARMRAEIAAEKAKIARERALAIWRAHHPTAAAPKSALPPPATTAVYFPDYLTSASVLLPSTYNTKRNAYQSPNWYLCPQHGHGSGTKASPFCLDDLPTGTWDTLSSGSAIMSTMKGGDTLALLPGTYNMGAGSGLNYLLVVPIGTPSNYSVVTASDPTNPPVLVGAPGGDHFVGNSLAVYPQTSANINQQGSSCTIYENLVLQGNGSAPIVRFIGSHIVVRNCDITGNQSSNYNNDNAYCIDITGERCQIYDNALHDNTPTSASGITNYPNSSAIGEYDSLYLDVFHNNLYNNNGGTFNKDSGAGWATQAAPVQTFINNGYTLPAPYTDLNAYRANFYHNGVAYELVGTNQGPNDTIYVRDNVFAGGAAARDTNAIYTNLSYQIVFQNNLNLMSTGIWVEHSPFYTYFRNNITWSPNSTIYPIWDGYCPFSQSVLPLFMDNNVYIGPAGTTAFTTQDVYGAPNNNVEYEDLQQMKQYGRELHSLVYASPSQVFSDPSKYMLLPQFLKAASDGLAVGPRVAIDYITNPAWYGPNAALNPYKLGISTAP